MEYFVYILRSLTNSRHYVGSTNNLQRRLIEHNAGKNKSTKGGIPLTLVYKEKYLNKKAALKREKQIKSYKGGNAFKKLLCPCSSVG